MRTPVKLTAFGSALAVVFTGAFGVGALVGDPLGGPAASAGHRSASQAGGHGSGHGGPSAPPAADGEPSSSPADLPGGLMVSDRGYTLHLAQDTLPAGTDRTLSLRILEADGRPVTSYTTSHDKDLHLIAVRRDGTSFQHVHPELGGDGTWSTPLDLSPGSWRVFADFVPAQGPAAGQTLTLGADLAVPGDHQPMALPAPSPTAQVDGYTVTLDGALVPGQESRLTLSVSRDGRPVTDLQPYLAAYGHLVALRAGDLAYLHVHPDGEPGDGKTPPGPGITFYATAPSAGDYRLFLDFRHGDVVRTAEFTARAGTTSTRTSPSPSPSASTAAAVSPTATPTATPSVSRSPGGAVPTRQPTGVHRSDGHTH